MKISTAKILTANTSDFIRDQVVAKGLHMAFGDNDVIIDCEILERRESDMRSIPDMDCIIDEAIKEGCDYIHLF